MTDEPAVRRYRAIWISDVHLGTRASKAEQLLEFLRNTESEYLYLVGDIIDGWRLRKTWYWPRSHNDVIQALVRKARRGTKVYYLPGNHDEIAREFLGYRFGEITIVDDLIHETADGRRLLVIHGDQFDAVVRQVAWLAHLGDVMYVLLLSMNVGLNRVRRWFGRPYWSLSAYLKQRTKQAMGMMGKFETLLTDEARRRGVCGVVCGHVHTAGIKDKQGITYLNDGDWVESCTALVEHAHGALEIIRCVEIGHADSRPAQSQRQAA